MKEKWQVYKYIQIAKGYRKEGKVKHKTIAYLGQLSQKEKDSLIKGLNRLKEHPFSLKSLDLKHRREYLYGDIFLLSCLWEKLDYNKILRVLEHLERVKDLVEEGIFWNHISLFSQRVDLVFYDITSSYFEGQGPSIARKGYSSDRRPDRNQIVLALAVTKEGIPIAHEVYEGSKKHSRTVIDTK